MSPAKKAATPAKKVPNPVKKAPSPRKKPAVALEKTAWGMVAEAKTRIENLTPTQVVAEVMKGALLVDIREPNERTEKGTIPGALHAVRGMLEFYADPSADHYHRPEFEPGRRIILHCAVGGRSALAAVALAEMGHDVAHLDGGFEAWTKAGMPVEEG